MQQPPSTTQPPTENPAPPPEPAPVKAKSARLQNFTNNFKKISIDQKISLFVLTSILVALPIAITLVIQPKLPFLSRAGSPATPPVENYPPSITTTVLPDAKIGRNYKATITGQDLDLNDDLNMLIRGLPPGVALKSCQEKNIQVKRTKSKIREISCTVSGKPTASGEFSVEVTLNDGKATIIRSLPLSIE